MAELPSVEAYLEGKSPEGIALPTLRGDRGRVRPLGGGAAQLDLYRKRGRVFVGAFVNGRKLELNVDLVREAQHPCLLAAFHTTKRVVTHRLRISRPTELDESLVALVVEAYEDVGPGFRGM